MRLRLVYPVQSGSGMRKLLKQLNTKPENEEKIESSLAVVCLIDPGKFRQIDEGLRDITQCKGSLEVLNLKEIVDPEERL